MRSNIQGAIKPADSSVENIGDTPKVPILAENAIRKVSQPKRALYNYLKDQFAKGSLVPGGRVIPKSQMVRP